MNIKKDFKLSFIDPPVLPEGFSADTLLGQVYTQNSDEPFSSFVQVYSHADHVLTSPISYHIRSLNCYLILLTKKGCGTFRYQEKNLALPQMSLLFFDCRQPFALSMAQGCWSFELYLLDGSLISAFFQSFKNCEMPLSITEYSCILQQFKALEENNKNYIARSVILDIKCFTNILSNIALLSTDIGGFSESVPSYLAHMKKCFDFSYEKQYSLDKLEALLGISKYRLCREFTAAYGISPLQYLHKRRLIAAKDLLLTTELAVHEVGLTVGFENTNHFIHLFKRDCGITPNAFRQAGRISVK